MLPILSNYLTSFQLDQIKLELHLPLSGRMACSDPDLDLHHATDLNCYALFAK